MSGDVRGWRELLDAVGAAGDSVTSLAGDAPEIDVAEGLRFVLTVVGDQLDRAALRDTSRPLFLPGITPVRKLFFDNPDTDYDTAFVRGNRDYVVRGTRGSATYLSFCLYSGNPGRGQATRATNLPDADMKFEDDGSFELRLSATEQPGNWLRLEPDSHLLIARQYYLDRETAVPAAYRIDLVGDHVPDVPLTPERFASTANAAAGLVKAATDIAIQRVQAARAQTNMFTYHAGHGVYGTPDARYVACWYELAEDEALVVTAQPPQCRYWGVHLANRWGQSLDSRTRTTVLNSRTSAHGDDGSYRFVVAGRDPGEANWLDTAGHPCGWVLFRWLLSEDVPMPEATVVRLRNP